MAYIAVVWIDTGVITYCGESELEAAKHLVRGTTFARGESSYNAKEFGLANALAATRIPGGYALSRAMRTQLDAIKANRTSAV